MRTKDVETGPRAWQIRISVLVALLCFMGPLFCQDKPLALHAVSFHPLTIEDGLSQGTINAILRDKQGLMWFATQEGLNVFDGYTFKVYRHDPSDSRTLSANWVRALHEDKLGRLWIGAYGGGLNRLITEPGKSETVQRFPRDPNKPGSLMINTVTALCEDTHGALWIGSYRGGLSRMDLYGGELGRFQHFASNPADPASLPGRHVTALYETRDGKLLVGTRDGGLAYTLHPEANEPRFRRAGYEPGWRSKSESKRITTIFQDHQGVIWVGAERGLFKFDSENGLLIPADVPVAGRFNVAEISIAAIVDDEAGRLWIGTNGAGLGVLDAERQEISHYDYISDRISWPNFGDVRSLYSDNAGSVWVGTSTGIVQVRRKRRSFETFRFDHNDTSSLSYNVVWSFGEDKDGDLWVGTKKGLNLFDRQNYTFRRYFHDSARPSSLSDDDVRAIYTDALGRTWIGADGGGLGLLLSKKSGLRFRNYRHDPDDPASLSNDRVMRVYQDRTGILWIGTYGGGLNRFDPESGKFTPFRHDKTDSLSLAHNTVYGIQEDHLGILWVGTLGGGLSYVLPRDREAMRFHTFRHNSADSTSLGDNTVTHVFEDSRGTIWVSTISGLSRFDRKTNSFKTYTQKDTLANSLIYGMTEDESGRLWVSTNHGLSSFDPARMDFKNYDISDGLQSNEFCSGAYYKDHGGTLFFGGINGFSCFHPDSLRDVDSRPAVVLRSVRIFNRPLEAVAGMRELHLSHEQNTLSFEFAAIEYSFPKKTEYAYMMTGVDKDWNRSGTRHYATYTNLSPGHYTFMVKTASHGHMSQAAPLSLDITITPPFWRTPWFLALAVFSVISLVVTGEKTRVSRIERHNRQLEHEVAIRTEELKSKNEKLRETLSELKRMRVELLDNAHKAGMADLATGVLHNVGNLLNSVNTSTALVEHALKNSKLSAFKKANNLLRRNMDNIEQFILNDPKGGKLLEYYLRLEAIFENENQFLRDNIQRLTETVAAICDVIGAQQNYATGRYMNENLSLVEVVKDALTLESASISRHDIEVEQRFLAEPMVKAQRAKVIQILTNLYKNAKEAMQEVRPGQRKITVIVESEHDKAFVRVVDVGHGIREEDKKKIFSHGFTTKENGHGFGLHSCSNYMAEMGGEMWAKSKGEGKGAEFVLSFPLKDDE